LNHSLIFLKNVDKEIIEAHRLDLVVGRFIFEKEIDRELQNAFIFCYILMKPFDSPSPPLIAITKRRLVRTYYFNSLNYSGYYWSDCDYPKRWSIWYFLPKHLLNIKFKEHYKLLFFPLKVTLSLILKETTYYYVLVSVWFVWEHARWDWK